MKWSWPLLALAVAACTKNSFQVEDPHRMVRAATLTLCGSETPLERSGGAFELSRLITCEGHG